MQPSEASSVLGLIKVGKFTAFTTDIPAFGGVWGQPYLIGPGSIHVAHTSEERIPKEQILEAVQIYKRMVQQLL